MSAQAVREYLILIWGQYQEASRRQKSKLLDEVIRNTGMHRVSAKRLLGRKCQPQFRRGAGKSVNSYSDTARSQLKILWRDMGYLGAKRLRGAIPDWIDKWEAVELNDFVRHELCSMSASTVERVLKNEKAKLRRRLNTGTNSKGNKIKTAIPIRDLEFYPSEPGHCEIDCVAHCGGSLSGEHAWTLTVVDILTGHTEEEALQFKNGWEVMLALHRIEDRLPFPILALYMDNGCEFLNADVKKRFSEKKHKIDRETIVKLFRSRPYKKNDQCYVEQKNYTHVRELFGYDRITGKLLVQQMNNIYRNEWRLLSNYFYPQIRLKSKERNGSKITRRFHEPSTPFEQLKKYLPAEKIAVMQAEKDALNPFELRKRLKRRLRDFQAYNSRPPDKLGKYAIRD